MAHTKEDKELRRCIVTGESLPKTQLIRFVAGPGKVLVPDIAGVLPGKGLWVKCRLAFVKVAVEKKLFSKAARMQVMAPPHLPEQVEALQKQACLSMLSMAKKSGMLVTGYTKLCALQEEKNVALILRARDSAFAANERQPLSKGVQVVTLFSNDELSSALGCENVVHCALKGSAIAEKCRILIERYALYIKTIEPSVGK